eukprot:749481-Hanusia_phi.AAC.12
MRCCLWDECQFNTPTPQYSMRGSKRGLHSERQVATVDKELGIAALILASASIVRSARRGLQTQMQRPTDRFVYRSMHINTDDSRGLESWHMFRTLANDRLGYELSVSSSG